MYTLLFPSDTEYARLLPLFPYFCLQPLTPLISGAAALAEVKVESFSISGRQTGAVRGHGVQRGRGHSEVGKGRKGKSELEKHSRELEGRRMEGGGREGGELVKSARTCGEKHSARQALKLHSKAVGVKQCQSRETHRAPLAKTQPRVKET